jgi:hypothetical protein
VTLLKGDGGTIGTLVLGKREGDRYFARAGDSPVYAIPARAVGEVPKIPDDFKG